MYRDPVVLDQVLAQRTRDAAPRAQVTPGDLRRKWLLQRLLARVFAHEPHGWLLKGGHAMLQRFDGARHTRDIDLMRHREEPLPETAGAITRAAATDLGDLVRFEPFAVTDRSTQTYSPSVTVRFRPILGTKEDQPISVDITPDTQPLGRPEPQQMTQLLNLDFGETTLQLVSREDHLADKICAMYEYHRGHPSSRTKDLIDIVMLATATTRDGTGAHTLSGPLLRESLIKEEYRRRSLGVDLRLPTQFLPPQEPIWKNGYDAHVRRTPGLSADWHTFDSAVALADQLLKPLLRGDRVESWNPHRQQWAATTAASGLRAGTVQHAASAFERPPGSPTIGTSPTSDGPVRPAPAPYHPHRRVNDPPNRHR